MLTLKLKYVRATVMLGCRLCLFNFKRLNMYTVNTFDAYNCSALLHHHCKVMLCS